jgi:hypothetical protein
MNVRYGPSAPPIESPCIMCNGLASNARTFPCGCVYPIHESCVRTFRRIGGICPKCNQVWIAVETQSVPNDRLTDSTYAITRSQNEWLLEYNPQSGSRTICGCVPFDSYRIRFIYSIFCAIILIFGGVCSYLLIRLYA